MLVDAVHNMKKTGFQRALAQSLEDLTPQDLPKTMANFGNTIAILKAPLPRNTRPIWEVASERPDPQAERS